MNGTSDCERRRISKVASVGVRRRSRSSARAASPALPRRGRRARCAQPRYGQARRSGPRPTHTPSAAALRARSRSRSASTNSRCQSSNMKSAQQRLRLLSAPASWRSSIVRIASAGSNLGRALSDRAGLRGHVAQLDAGTNRRLAPRTPAWAGRGSRPEARLAAPRAGSTSSRRPRTLRSAGIEAANSISSWSRSGERASSACAIVAMSIWR